jgi:DNA-binding MarR family transcriptional regulator
MADSAGPQQADPPMPGWLSAAEQATWLALGALVMRLPAAVDADLQARSDVSLFEYLVLANLSEAPDHTLRMSDLGPRTNASPSRLSHGIARLERRGWVCRAPLLGDGRQIIATLTPAGLDKVQTSAPAHVQFVRRVIVDVLSPDQLAELHTIARTILTGLESRAHVECC